MDFKDAALLALSKCINISEVISGGIIRVICFEVEKSPPITGLKNIISIPKCALPTAS